ncbi:MAG: competence protein ComEC family protein [Oscillospiraceae bacterium]|nr:competence protein ComEC family protein [Oscillospiraceae bacterium]
MKLKSAVIGFSYLAGLICAFLLGLSSDYAFAGAAAVILAGLFLLRFKAQNIGVFALVFGFAFGVYGFHRHTFMDAALALDGETREVTGIVLDKTLPARGMAGYTVEAEIDGVKTRFSLYAVDAGAEVGDSIIFEARFSLLLDNTAFDEAFYYMSRGVVLKAQARTTPVAVKNESFSFTDVIRGFNEYLKNQIMVAFPNDTGALICAVFLGDKSRLSDDFSQSITRAGIAHYTAVSGLHLTLIAFMFMSVLNLTRLRNMRRLKFILLAVVTLIFMVFFNLSPSVTRAGIMLIVFYGGELFMRRGNTLNSIGFAALIILLISPYSALDAGLLLSIAGTIGIGVIAPTVNKHFTSERFKNVHEAIVMNLCANYATLPLVAIFFGGASLASIVTSVILLPFFTVLLVAIAVFALATPFASLGGFSLLIAGIMSRVMQIIIVFFGNFKFAYIPLNYDFILPWIIASAVFVVLAALVYKKAIAGVKAAFISLFALSMMVISTEYLNLDKTRFEVYTDGTSAAIFLRHRNNSVAIITDDSRRTARVTIDFLHNNFLDEIGLLIVLNSTNNSLRLFESIPAMVYSAPGGDDVTYDVGGVFTVTRNGNDAAIIYNNTTINVAHMRNSSYADLSVTYNFTVNSGDFKGDIIHTSRRAEAENENEFNAYFEKINWVLETQ